MFRGFSILSVDSKGRLAIPSRYRKRLDSETNKYLVLTLSPRDRSLWLYPLIEWEHVEAKLATLSDFDKQERRTKQMMRGYATDCQIDTQGRILIPQELRDYAELKKQVIILGQWNKFEIWDEQGWSEKREDWLQEIGDLGDPSETLKSLSL